MQGEKLTNPQFRASAILYSCFSSCGKSTEFLQFHSTVSRSVGWSRVHAFHNYPLPASTTASHSLGMQKPQPSLGSVNGTDKSRIAVLGASGYTGEEVIRLMALHPTFAPTVLTGESQAGKVKHIRPQQEARFSGTVVHANIAGTLAGFLRCVSTPSHSN